MVADLQYGQSVGGGAKAIIFGDMTSAQLSSLGTSLFA